MKENRAIRWFRRHFGLAIRVALKDKVVKPVFIIPTDELRLEYNLDLPDHGIRVAVEMQFLVSHHGIFQQPILDLALYPKAVEKL